MFSICILWRWKKKKKNETASPGGCGVGVLRPGRVAKTTGNFCSCCAGVQVTTGTSPGNRPGSARLTKTNRRRTRDGVNRTGSGQYCCTRPQRRLAAVVRVGKCAGMEIIENRRKKATEKNRKKKNEIKYVLITRIYTCTNNWKHPRPLHVIILCK